MNALPVTVPRSEPSYLDCEIGLRSWLLTKDHKRIALMFYGFLMSTLLLGGIFALLLRLELLTPGRTIMSAVSYNRLFTLHGIVMVFFFLIPSVPSVFGNFVLPLMLGARDLAFPRLNLASFYFLVVGFLVALGGMIAGGADTGWTFYLPYSGATPLQVSPVVLGIFLAGISSSMTGVNFIATVHTMRVRTMKWHDLPLFVWGIYGTSIIQVLATPVLGMALLLVLLDHSFHIGLFDPTVGGDPVLFQHLFWFYSHPAVYIMILPGMGVISELVPTFARRAPASYRAIAWSTLGIAFVGFFTWGHHLFTAGMSALDASIFGALSMFVGLFSAIKVFTWVATLYQGKIRFQTPMLYFFWFLFLFTFGGMTGVALATEALDVHWQDTYFVVAHFHFIMVGGYLSAFLAAAHYWFPKMFGRMYNERVGLLSSSTVFVGFVVTFLPQFLLGNWGMPRRYYYYPPEFQFLNVCSTAGASVLAAGLAMTALNLLVALRWGARAPRNPWGSHSYEWLTESPPPKHNFDGVLVPVMGPYDYTRPHEEFIEQLRRP